MKAQNYSNHVRYYVPHHFVFYPVMLVLIFLSLRFGSKYPDRSLEWYAIAVVLVMITWLSFMLRQHYALVNQNRTVRLEMRLRYYQLTHERLEDIETQLSFRQIAALRFASDAELPALVKRALTEQLSPDSIKKSIINWVPDTMRV
jgi:hypothetical protein